MIYNCPKCGLSKSDSAVGSVLPQCKCDWNSIPQRNDFNPDWDAMAVMVEEQQRMARRIEELEAALAQPEPEPVAYINVQERKLEWAKLTKWETPTVVKMDKVPLYIASPQSNSNIKLERMREIVKIQGYNGNWNCDPYMHGMYNGMEFMIAMLEDREPNYRAKPDVWLCELPPDKVIGAST